MILLKINKEMEELLLNFWSQSNTMETELKIIKIKYKVTPKEFKKFQWENQEYEHSL